ncbi:MAG TPA: RluA family pseudouridine synthase [Bacteroidales bacterium]|nr:RluA family pseudouridine synthase [Bacteroidales bacterium]
MDNEFVDVDNTNDDELFEHYRFVVDRGQGLLRIDKFLMDRIENASRTKIQAAATQGNIVVNDQPVKSSYKVKPGDIIRIMMEEPVREIELIAQDIPLDIEYEDEELIVVNKPAGMVVHPAYGNYTGTLVNALIFHLNKNIPEGTEPHPGPFLVHRIDKDTSGLMIAAKNEVAQRNLQSQFSKHSIDRVYNALVWSDFEEEEGTITGNIARSKADRKVFTVYDDPEIGKHAVTHYKVIERFGYVTMVECRLETGRTHQIRVHMRHIGHPLFNDETYGGNQILRGTTFSKYKQFVHNCFKICPRQALHARTLGFDHPTTGNRMVFERPLPEDMQLLTEKWRHYAIHKSFDDLET